MRRRTHNYHIQTTQDYGYEMDNPNEALILCEKIFDEATEPLLRYYVGQPTPERPEPSVYWSTLQDQAMELKSLLTQGSTWGMHQQYYVNGMKIRMTLATGQARELTFEVERVKGPNDQVLSTTVTNAFFDGMVTAAAYRQGSANFAATHVDAFDIMRNKGEAVAFNTTLWKSATEAQLFAPLGTIFAPKESGAYQFSATSNTRHKEPWRAVKEGTTGDGRSYRFDADGDHSTGLRYSACGEVLFSAAVPHRVSNDVVSLMQGYGVGRRFNIQFVVQAYPGLKGYAPPKRMMQIMPGKIPTPRWAKQSDIAAAATIAAAKAQEAVAKAPRGGIVGDSDEKFMAAIRATLAAEAAEAEQAAATINPHTWVHKPTKSHGYTRRDNGAAPLQDELQEFIDRALVARNAALERGDEEYAERVQDALLEQRVLLNDRYMTFSLVDGDGSGGGGAAAAAGGGGAAAAAGGGGLADMLRARLANIQAMQKIQARVLEAQVATHFVPQAAESDAADTEKERTFRTPYNRGAEDGEHYPTSHLQEPLRF